MNSGQTPVSDRIESYGIATTWYVSMYLCDFLHTLRTDAAFACLLRVNRSLLHQSGCICQLALQKLLRSMLQVK